MIKRNTSHKRWNPDLKRLEYFSEFDQVWRASCLNLDSVLKNRKYTVVTYEETWCEPTVEDLRS